MSEWLRSVDERAARAADTVRDVLAPCILAGLIAGFAMGFVSGTAVQLRAHAEIEAAHTERDALMRVRCAVADVAWQDWRGLAAQAVEAQYGPFILATEN